MTSDVRAALDAGDDGFHEIQLNGKQLVFLGMATTLVSVVIFLCGVLVGRGVKPLDTVAQAAGPQAFDAPVTSAGRARRHRHAGPGAAGDARPVGRRRPRRPRPPRPTATPSRRRSATNPTRRRPRRRATVPPPPRASRPAVEPTPRPPPKVEPREAAEAQAGAGPGDARRRPRRPPPAPQADARPGGGRDRGPATSAGGAIAVQVGAFATRKEADALAKRLSGRGYAVYVMNPMVTARTSTASASATTAPPTKRSASAPG